MENQILKKQYEIDKVFLIQPWKALTYSEIQKLSKNRSKGYIYKELKRLEKENIINSNRIGKRTIIYNMALNSASAQHYWGFIEEYSSWKLDKFPFHIIENLRSKMPTPFFTLLVTGSYAKRTETKSSDIDVVIISDFNKDKIYAELKYESETSIPKVHLYVFTKQDFLDMLASKKENYGKEITRNKRVFFGGASYYSIFSEAMEHGFKG